VLWAIPLFSSVVNAVDKRRKEEISIYLKELVFFCCAGTQQSLDSPFVVPLRCPSCLHFFHSPTTLPLHQPFSKMMYGSSSQFLYDVPFSDEEYEEDDQYEGGSNAKVDDGRGKERDHEGEYDEDQDELLARRLQYGELDDQAKPAEKVALADFIAPRRVQVLSHVNKIN
jgi:hypothetical protein